MSRATASGCSAMTGSRLGDRAATHRGRPSGALVFCRRREATPNGERAKRRSCGHGKRRFALTFAAPEQKNALGGNRENAASVPPFVGKGALAADREEKRWKNRAFGIHRAPCSLYVIMNAEAEILLSGFFHRNRAGHGSADHRVVALPELLDFPCFYSRPLYRGIPQNRAV